MSTLGTANNMHKATLDDRYQDSPVCFYCGEYIKRIQGGQGPTWVHCETGAVVGHHDPTNDHVQARQLVESVLRDADWVIPELARLITEDIIVPNYEVGPPVLADGDTDRLVTFMERMNTLLHNIVDLRALSHRDHTERPV